MQFQQYLRTIKIICQENSCPVLNEASVHPSLDSSLQFLHIHQFKTPTLDGSATTSTSILLPSLLQLFECVEHRGSYINMYKYILYKYIAKYVN